MSCRCLALPALVSLVLAVVPALAATPEQVTREIAGIDEARDGPRPFPDPDAHELARGMIPSGGLLLIPESPPTTG